MEDRSIVMTYLEKYQEWCNDEYFDQNTRNELKKLSAEEIKDRFYKDLEFGTGGLRGEIGAGTNRMNLYTVRKATQGLANYILKEGTQDKGIAIAYDSRRMSPEFAMETALCLAANGIKAYIFESLRPTPELSFALRELKCTAGVVITASHNPPEYNGYKVYWEDGAQITAPRDKEIIAEVNAIHSYKFINVMKKEEAIEKGLYTVIGEEIDNRYMQELKKLVLNSEVIHEQAKNLKIVYTPLHGTGNIPVRRILKELGFEQVYVVPEQEKPDGNFPTVSYPNPEEPQTFKMGIELAKKIGADLVLATDPDADRLGVYARDSKTGEYMPFTGNMSGMLICEYQLSQRKEKNILLENGAIVTTIVSSNMAKAVAKEYQVKLIETLTGFKYIGEQIKFFEQTGSNSYLFGFEESYGCLVGTHARDKDAVVAVMALCEAAAYYKSKNLTLWDQMIRIFDKYGYYKEALYTLTLKGQEGAGKINFIMENIRSNPPERIGEYSVQIFYDYEKRNVKNYISNSKYKTELPISNVLYFELSENAWCCIRPSGTEPKIKIYAGVKGNSLEDSETKVQKLIENAIAFLQ